MRHSHGQKSELLQQDLNRLGDDDDCIKMIKKLFLSFHIFSYNVRLCFFSYFVRWEFHITLKILNSNIIHLHETLAQKEQLMMSKK